MLARQQHVEQHAQGINIGSSRDWLAGELLWRSVLGSKGRTGFAREQGCGTHLAFALQEFGNPEVQQLDFTAGGDQHVRRFDIAMDNQIRMGVRHCGQHIQKQANACIEVELVLVAILIDGVALDILQD